MQSVVSLQISILGPFLFLLPVTDIKFTKFQYNISLFANDTTMTLSHSNNVHKEQYSFVIV